MKNAKNINLQAFVCVPKLGLLDPWNYNMFAL